MIVSLPGILMQGRKYKWAKYKILYTEVESENFNTLSGDLASGQQKMMSNNYIISNGKFVLIDPFLGWLAAHYHEYKYHVNRDQDTTQGTSGKTLYRVDSTTPRTYGGVVGEVVNTYNATSISGFMNTKESPTFGIQLTGEVSTTSTNGVPRYSNKSTPSGATAGTYEVVYEHILQNGVVTVRKVTPVVATYYAYITKFTLASSKGAYVEDVISKNKNAYPMNGVKNGYWYVFIGYGSGSGLDPEPNPEPEVNYVEYIQSSGTQRIDTGYKPNQSTRVIMDAQWVSTPSKDSCLFGARKASGNVDNSLWYVSASGVLQSSYGNEKIKSSAITVTTRHTYDKNGNTLYVDGTTRITNTKSTFQTDYNMFLLTCNQSGSAMSNSASVKLYSCKIYDNNVLIRDYRPCLDPNGVACLYDEVNKEYVYNSGSGSFTAA